MSNSYAKQERAKELGHCRDPESGPRTEGARRDHCRYDIAGAVYRIQEIKYQCQKYHKNKRKRHMLSSLNYDIGDHIGGFVPAISCVA